MKKFNKIAVFGLASCLFLVSCEQDSSNPQMIDNRDIVTSLEGELVGNASQTLIPNQYIVILKSNAFVTNIKELGYEESKALTKQVSDDLLRTLAISTSKVSRYYSKTIPGFVINLNDTEMNLLKNHALVQIVEQDKEVGLIHAESSTSDATGNGNNGKGKPGGGSAAQTTPYGITRVGGGLSGAGKTAWIIDSGIDMDHEDLNVDAARSQTFLGGNSTPDDQNGHGSHVAGTIAAINNSVGVVGVAAGASVVAVRVLDRRGSGTTSGVIAGVDYVGASASNGDVANMSLGGGASSSLDLAVLNASSACKFVLAAGNESMHANNSSPARVNGPNIYTVSAMNASDNWASFSNYGNPPVDYCAPGVSIYSTYKSGGYATLNGTSMAAPHVAGLVLLGNVNTNGYVNGDPDGNPDPIAHR